MPWTHTGVRRRLKLLGALGIAGGLLLTSVSAALAQGVIQDQPVENEMYVAADFASDGSVNLGIPGTFFPGFAMDGSVSIPAGALLIDGNKIPVGGIIVESLDLPKDQTRPELIAPHPDRPYGSIASYMERAVEVSVIVDSMDVTQEALFNPPMTVELHLTPSEWAEASNDPYAFVLRAWDPSLNRWLSLETYTEPFDRLVKAKLARAGRLGLFLELTPPPIQGGDIAINSMFLLLIGLGGLALATTGVMMVRGTARRRSR